MLKIAGGIVLGFLSLFLIFSIAGNTHTYNTNSQQNINSRLDETEAITLCEKAILKRIKYPNNPIFELTNAMDLSYSHHWVISENVHYKTANGSAMQGIFVCKIEENEKGILDAFIRTQMYFPEY